MIKNSGLYVTIMPVIDPYESMKMLTSSASQYLPPDYLQPLPTTVSTHLQIINLNTILELLKYSWFTSNSSPASDFSSSFLQLYDIVNT